MVVKILVRCWLFCIAFQLNPPYTIILRRCAFLSIGAVGGESGGGHHWREQTEAREIRIVPMYPLQAHQFVLGYSLNVVQVEVLQAHQVVVVVVRAVFVRAVAVFVLLVVIVPRQLRQRGKIEEQFHGLKFGSRLSTGSPFGFSERLELGLRLCTRDSDVFGTTLLPHSNLLYRIGSSS